MDIRVALTSQDLLPNPEAALETAMHLAARLHIAHRPTHVSRRPFRFPHCFLGDDPTIKTQLLARQQKHHDIRVMNGFSPMDIDQLIVAGR